MNTLIVGSLLVAVALAAPQRARNPEATARILNQASDIQFDGTFNSVYETENGISSQVSGRLKNAGIPDQEIQEMEGSYSYTAPDGTPIQVRFTANENGFQAQGAHLPTPPPIPPAILRALDYIRSLPPSKDNRF